MKPIIRSVAVCLSVVSPMLLAYGIAFADGWPQFRGPDGQGHAETSGVPIRWSESLNVAWKTELPGRGYSSPVIEGDEIWMTAAVESPLDEDEKSRRLEGSTNNQPLTLSGPLSMRAICVQRSTGQLSHDIELMTTDRPDPIHSLNSYASPTPVLENGRLYCHFGTNGTACLDTTTGKVRWTNRELTLNHENGAGSSPVLFKDLLIFHADGSDVQYIVALNKFTGEVAWRTDRSGEMNSNPQLKKAYGTPLIVTDESTGRSLLMSPAADWLYCYNPLTGKELWRLNYGVLGFSIVPRPVAKDGLLYLCTSFMRSELLAIRYEGEEDGEASSPEIVWRYARQVPQKPSPLIVGDEIYIVGDRGVATCLDTATGTVRWTERLGGNYSASPIHAGGYVYFSNQEGETTVIEPGREFKAVATNKLDGRHMASAAAVDGALYFRTDKALYRLQDIR